MSRIYFHADDWERRLDEALGFISTNSDSVKLSAAEDCSA